MQSFEEMLDDLYSNLEFKNNSIKIVLPTPVLIKHGNKTVWKNVKDYLKLFDRDPEHFISYINNETTNKVFWLTESKSDGCIFQNKIKKDYVFELMKKYIKDKVLCKNCHTINTKLFKIKELRKFQLQCGECKSDYII